MMSDEYNDVHTVSTHSRPKAAGHPINGATGVLSSFNTQPPEGGWQRKPKTGVGLFMFQHTAARRRLVNFFV